MSEHNSWTKAAGQAIGDGIATAGKAIARAIESRPVVIIVASGDMSPEQAEALAAALNPKRLAD